MEYSIERLGQPSVNKRPLFMSYNITNVFRNKSDQFHPATANQMVTCPTLPTINISAALLCFHKSPRLRLRTITTPTGS